MKNYSGGKEICWDCGKQGADDSYIEYDPCLVFNSDNDLTVRRETLKGKRRESGDDMRHRMFCHECFEKRNEELRRMREEYARLKKLLMFERAIKILEKQALDIYQYKDVIDDLKQYVQEKPEKFDSAHEMIAAIILVDNAIKAKIQHKVGSYRVDFFIPDYKIILEIDGEMHAHNLYRDNERDKKIREILGDEWETVRIGTKYIEQNAPALPNAMVEVRNEKKKLRKSHNGYLPEWYSTRNKAQRTRSIKAGDDHLFEIE